MSCRILLVDDEPQILELLGLFLARHGYEVFKAGSSTQALELLERENVELVLLDIGLAEEDGLKVLPVLKSQHPKVKVIMLTGMGFVEDLLEEAQQKGADGYVSKALPLDEVLEAMNQVLKPKLPQVHSSAA